MMAEKGARRTSVGAEAFSCLFSGLSLIRRRLRGVIGSDPVASLKRRSRLIAGVGKGLRNPCCSRNERTTESTNLRTFGQSWKETKVKDW